MDESTDEDARRELERALELLDRGEITVSRAADLADCSVRKFATIARERVVSWDGDDHLADDLDSL
jgi:predicted HTH domain antitoxin